MGKTRDLFKKIGEIMGIFHVRMGKIKDRNGKYLTEPEEIKKYHYRNHMHQEEIASVNYSITRAFSSLKLFNHNKFEVRYV